MSLLINRPARAALLATLCAALTALAACGGGGDEHDECPAAYVPPAGQAAIPATPCGAALR